MKIKAFCAALTVLVSASLAYADLAIYDPFLVGSPAVAANGEYNTGNIGGQNPAIDGFTNAWRTLTFSGASGSTAVTGTGLSYGVLPVTGGALSLGQNQRAIREFSAPVTAATAGTLYMSFLFQYTGTQYAGVELNNGGDADANRVLAFGVGTAGSNFQVLRGTGSFQNTDVARNTNVNLVVFRFDLSADNNADGFRLYVNPDLTAPEPIAANFSFSNTNVVFDRLQIGRFGVTSLNVDEFRLGSTWDAVVIPEPSSWMLVACGLLGLLALRRRR